MVELRNAVACVKGVGTGFEAGTAFFIDNDGTLLTCFHLVKDQERGRPIKSLTVVFNKQEYPAECIWPSSSSPDEVKMADKVDMAVLRLKDGKPSEALVLPLGEWRYDKQQSCEFKTFGFRESRIFEGLPAAGTIGEYVTLVSSGVELLQLESEAIGKQTLRGGMSGSPVYHEASGRVVGIISERYVNETREETIPFAVPIEKIGELYLYVQFFLHKEYIIRQLEHIEGILFNEPFTDFYNSLPFFELPKCTSLEDMSMNFLKWARSGDEIYNLVNWIKDNYYISIYKKIILPDKYLFNFVNRKDERSEACGNNAAQYILFDAPAGYGKTELLRAIEHEHAKAGWCCIHIKKLSVMDLIYSLAECIDDQKELVKFIENVVSEDFSDRFKLNHRIIFIIDNIEKFPIEEIDSFLNKSLPTMQRVLPNFRVRMAGRYIGGIWDGKAREIPLLVRPLSPFQFRHVRATVQPYFSEKNETALDLFAAQIMHITGGHPRLMAQIINQDIFKSDPIAVFQKCHEEQILESAREIRKSIPDKLKNIFDVLSVFRRYNHRILKEIIKFNLIEWQDDVNELEDALTSTYLVKRKNGFIQDEIVRRLLAIRLRLEENECFLDLCWCARDIYQADLQNSISRPEIIAIEGMYQELQLGCSDNPANREKLYCHFFADDGILRNYLELLIKYPDGVDNIINLKSRLEDEKREWEFRFMVNFCLRGEQFNEEPYEQLCKQIEKFYKEPRG
ncbi:hypothetical protein GCAAIG_03555 [Candidatus Electronema halotolerans]